MTGSLFPRPRSGVDQQLGRRQAKHGRKSSPRRQCAVKKPSIDCQRAMLAISRASRDRERLSLRVANNNTCPLVLTGPVCASTGLDQKYFYSSPSRLYQTSWRLRQNESNPDDEKNVMDRRCGGRIFPPRRRPMQTPTPINMSDPPSLAKRTTSKFLSPHLRRSLSRKAILRQQTRASLAAP